MRISARSMLGRSTEKIHLWRKITIVVGEPIYFSMPDLGSGWKDLYTRSSQRVMMRSQRCQLPDPRLRREIDIDSFKVNWNLVSRRMSAGSWSGL